MAMNYTRREVLQLAGAGALAWGWPGFSVASTGKNSRLIVVILRGGMDGLQAVPAYGEPRFASLRGSLSTGAPGGEGSSLKLDGTFALHPEMKHCAQLYGAGQFLVVHAVAPPYRERSHFEAQDCLENGTASPHLVRDGWLNRAAQQVPDAGCLAIADALPLILRGSVPAETWSPSPLADVSAGLAERLKPLYARDERLNESFHAALANGESTMGIQRAQGKQLPNAMRDAARFMNTANGPRLVVVQDGGWDTHYGQSGMLKRKLGGIDAALKAAQDALGPLWKETAVVFASEFGRTIRVNGSAGTDHGVGSVMLLAGGAVKGGRVLADWPGLEDKDMDEKRYLRATTDSRAVFKGVLRDHLGLPESALAKRVFPDSRAIKPLEGLIAS